MNLDDMQRLCSFSAENASVKTGDNGWYNAAMRPGLQSALLIGFVLSIIVAAVFFGTAYPAAAAVVYTQPTSGSTNTQLMTPVWSATLARSATFVATAATDLQNATVSFSLNTAPGAFGAGYYLIGVYDDTANSELISDGTYTGADGTMQARTETLNTGHGGTGSLLTIGHTYDLRILSFTGSQNVTYISDGSGNMTVTLCDSTGCAPANTTSRIESISPENASTTASTSVPITIEYYSNSADGLTELGVTLWDVTKNFKVVVDGLVASTTPDADIIATSMATLTSGDTYKLTAFLTNDAGDALVSADSNTTGAAADGSSEFSVVSNLLPSTFGTSTTAAAFGLATSSCSILNPTGCFQNAISWAFYPSGDILQMLAQDGQQLKTRPPLGYIFSTVGALQLLAASGTPAFALTEDWPIMHYIFSPFVTLLSTAVWFLFAVGLFHRTRKIEI